MHAAPDRAAGVVDEEVAAAVLLDDARHQRIARREIGDVRRIDERLAARALDLGLRFEQLLFAARDEDHLSHRRRRARVPSPCRCPTTSR
jgi:hypothetical protein